VALRDLELRGAGTILGTKQSGIIQSIGFNFYNNMLENAITAVQKGESIAEQIETPKPQRKLFTEIDLYFPPDYISDDEQRLTSIVDERIRKLTGYRNQDLELKDRFGTSSEKASVY
jgi:transcription-repair coupling factor (superfamily II helicase)